MKQYIVDAFTEKIFSGNPAAVCILDSFPSEDIMQSIATENNLSETAFAVKENDRYHIRWFTPKSEIDFCGHATLATAFVLFNYYAQDADTLNLFGQIGEFTVRRSGDLIRIGSITDYDHSIQNFETNCVPPDVFKMDYTRYPEFLGKRRVMMAKKIRKYYEML